LPDDKVSTDGGAPGAKSEPAPHSIRDDGRVAKCRFRLSNLSGRVMMVEVPQFPPFLVGGFSMKRVSIVMAALFALTVFVAQAADSAHTGWISDSMCGAKHAGSGGDCVKKCIEGGMKPVFVDSKNQVWSIDNPGAVKKDFYGARVTVKASEDAANKSMHIEAVEAAK
jgi:hypothetical protein